MDHLGVYFGPTYGAGSSLLIARTRMVMVMMMVMMKQGRG
jgi:hypothetical protein